MPIRAFAAGSAGAQRFIRVGRKPVMDLHSILLFEATSDVKRLPDAPMRGEIPVTADAVKKATARLAAGHTSVPHFVILRHHERRFNRLGVKAWVLVLIGVVGLVATNMAVTDGEVCGANGQCVYPTPPLFRLLGIATTALAVAAVSMLGIAWRYHRRADTLEAAESNRSSNQEINRTPGWRPPAD